MIPVSRPDLGEQELAQLRDSLESGWLGLGPKVDEFESKFKQVFGYHHAIPTNSCTSALDLALKAVPHVSITDQQRGADTRDVTGSEVLVPPITWVSTAFAAMYNHYDVQFVDVDETLCMDVDDLKRKISAETAAVIPVHYGGQPAEIDQIVDIAHAHQAAVIEDCAHAVGAKFNDQHVGSVGDMGCFSFEATKPLTTGEGGMLVTDDEHVAAKVRRWSKLGVDKSTHERSDEGGYSWYYEVTDIGYKYFMHDVSAGIGLAQLERFDQLQNRRREIADQYAAAFRDSEWVDPLPSRATSEERSWYNYTVFVPAADRDEIVEWLGERDIGASVHYMPIYKHPIFEGKQPDTPTTETLWERILTIPMSPTMTDDDVERVIEGLLSYEPT